MQRFTNGVRACHGEALRNDEARGATPLMRVSARLGCALQETLRIEEHDLRPAEALQRDYQRVLRAQATAIAPRRSPWERALG